MAPDGPFGPAFLLHVAQRRLYLDSLLREQGEAVVEQDVIGSSRKISGLNFGLSDSSAVVVSVGSVPVLEVSEPIFIQDEAVDVVSSASRGCEMAGDCNLGNVIWNHELVPRISGGSDS